MLNLANDSFNSSHDFRTNKPKKLKLLANLKVYDCQIQYIYTF